MNNQVMTNEKNNNKGFSLVELIIVIAIMAILVGIVGSQVIPYLNRSREAKDQQILSAWVTAAESAYSMNAATCTNGLYTITVSDTAVTCVGTDSTTTDDELLRDTFAELTGLTVTSGYDYDGTNGMASTTYQEITSVSFLVTVDSSVGGAGAHTVTVSAVLPSTVSIDTTALVAD